MAEAQKDTIYIDVDDEITSIIDKLRNAPHKIVALVLPKRATVLQSIVNMKLLKKAGDDTKKHIVLITSEAGLLPLAGAVKLHVAKTLQSKPEIPSAPDVPSNDVALEEAEMESEPELDASKPVGELAGDKKAAEPEETIDLDEPTEEPVKKKAGKSAKKADKKLKVPNFNSFRKRLLLIGVGVVGLIVFLILAIFVLPKATVTLKTDNLTVDTDIAFTASTAAQEFDEQAGLIPAVSKEVAKTDTEKVAATGKKNVGEKASGTAQFINCNQADKLTDNSRVVPSGTVITNNGLSFVTTGDAVVPPSGFKDGGSCKSDKASSPVNVIAQNPGDQYNLSSRSYSVSGFSTMTATGSAMSGGTNREVKVVSQEDVDNVKQKITEKSKGVAREELKKSLEGTDLFPLVETFSNNETKFSSSPNVGDESAEVTVTGATTFKMLGVQRDDLKKLVEASAKDKIDSDKQKVADDGLDDAVFRLVDAGDGNKQKLTAQVQITTGTQINESDVKQQIKGKKRGDIEKALQTYPGVKAVEVKFGPFWVSKAPKKESRINIVLEKALANDQQQ